MGLGRVIIGNVLVQCKRFDDAVDHKLKRSGHCCNLLPQKVNVYIFYDSVNGALCIIDHFLCSIHYKWSILATACAVHLYCFLVTFNDV